jgi:hypothetical protein
MKESHAMRATDPHDTPIDSDEEWKDQGWSETPAKVQIAEAPTTVISIRLEREQLLKVRSAARAKRQTMSAFVRESVLASAEQVAADQRRPVTVKHVSWIQSSTGTALRSDERGTAELPGAPVFVVTK